MPFLNTQIDIMNDHLKRMVFSDARFNQGLIIGLASLTTVSEDDAADKRYPVYYGGQVEPKYIGIDDTYPLIVYHRQQSGSTFTNLEQDSYGDVVDRIEMVTEMLMVVYGKRKALRMNAEDLETMCILGAPSLTPRSTLTGTKIDKLSIQINSTNMDALAVFGEEYQGVDFRVSPEEFLFNISYSLTAQYRKDCVKPCDCLPQ
jgi:hypothetical protein